MIVRSLAALAALLLLQGAAPAAAQDTPVRAAPPAATPRTGGWGAVDVSARPDNPTVSVTVVFPRGSAEDPADQPGAAWLLGRVVRNMVLEGLDPAATAATEIAVDVSRSHIALRMVTLPRYWEDAFGVLDWATFRGTPSETAMGRAKAELREVFAFERDAPHREFEVELYRMLGEGDPAWSRVPRGAAATVETVGSTALASFRDRVLLKEEAAVSVVGGVDPGRAARALTDGPVIPEGGLTSPTFEPLPARDEGPDVWDHGMRRVATREVTSTWIGVAWPVDPETSRTATDMLADRLDREFNSEPPDPGAFSVEVRLELMGSHELLVVEAAVLPEAVDQWERRILSVVGQVASTEMDEPFFRADRRRFRGTRLLADAPPEVQSLRRAMDLLHLGRVRDLAAEISELTPDHLQEAADDLEEPKVFILGPDLGDSGVP